MSAYFAGHTEKVYLYGYENISEAKAGIGRYMDFYNTRRPHSSLDRQTPDDVCFAVPSLAAAA